MPTEYLALAKARYEHVCAPYRQPEEFGYDFREWVSPYTKGAHVFGSIAVVLQDWASEDKLAGGRIEELQRYGRLRDLRTNRMLEQLLQQVLDFAIEEVYVTNAFPFVKVGSMSSRLNASDVRAAARHFASEELRIVKPKQVLALGAVAHLALVDAGVPCVRVPHPAARIGGLDEHAEAWSEALSS